MFTQESFSHTVWAAGQGQVMLDDIVSTIGALATWIHWVHFAGLPPPHALLPSTSQLTFAVHRATSLAGITIGFCYTSLAGITIGFCYTSLAGITIGFCYTSLAGITIGFCYTSLAGITIGFCYTSLAGVAIWVLLYITGRCCHLGFVMHGKQIAALVILNIALLTCWRPTLQSISLVFSVINIKIQTHKRFKTTLFIRTKYDM